MGLCNVVKCNVHRSSSFNRSSLPSQAKPHLELVTALSLLWILSVPDVDPDIGAAADSSTSSHTSSTSIQCSNSHFPYVHVSIFWSCDKKSALEFVEVSRSIKVLQSAGTSEELFLSLDLSIFILALDCVHYKIMVSIRSVTMFKKRGNGEMIFYNEMASSSFALSGVYK